MSTSLNGDVFVMRNGRSTSQVSIYNYPEHLNPFYEDDQHKRLRFWPIHKLGSNGERRNSFSLGGLKDMWGFKSMRLKKKSSTLGINKTSESPPPLRRDQQYSAVNNLSVPDYRLRYSSPADSVDFQRNGLYRSSLQTVSNSKEGASPRFDFNRSMHVPGTRTQHRAAPPVPQPRRYVYGGSVTPQPLRNADCISANGSREGLTRGSSQISVASTNPFETDDDDVDNNEDITFATDAGGITTSTPNKRVNRKKRRAPAPPTVTVHKSTANGSIHSTNDSSQNSSQDSSQPLQELHIEESLRSIANLTAQIENLVKTTNIEDKAQTSDPTKITTKTRPNGIVTSKHNDSHAKTDLPSSSPTARKTTTKTTVESQTKDNDTSNEYRVMVETQKEPTPTPTPRSNRAAGETEVGHVECIHIHLENARTTPERNEPSRVTSFRTEKSPTPEPEHITTKTSFTLSSPPVTRRDICGTNNSRKNSLKKTTVSLHPTETLKFPETEELKITEDSSASSPENKSPSTIKPPVPTKPHLAEIHKPARGIFVGEARHEVTPESRIAPISPKPPVRHSHNSTTVKETTTITTTQTDVVKPAKLSASQMETSFVPVEGASKTPITVTESLTIRESHEDLLEPKSQPSIISKPVMSDQSTSGAIATTVHTPQSPNALREEVLDSIYRPKPSTSYMEWKKSSLAPLEANVPPEKRKSVKDIIESINRSQRLLNAAAQKDPTRTVITGSDLSIGETPNGGTPLPHRKFSAPTIERNLIDSQRDTQRIIQQIENGNACSSSGTQADDNKVVNGGNCEEDPQKLNNNEIFKKCKVKKETYDFREQSPTSSNLDWNPVPKPKRNMNFSEH